MRCVQFDGYSLRYSDTCTRLCNSLSPQKQIRIGKNEGVGKASWEHLFISCTLSLSHTHTNLSIHEYLQIRHIDIMQTHIYMHYGQIQIVTVTSAVTSYASETQITKLNVHFDIQNCFYPFSCDLITHLINSRLLTVRK